MGLVLMLGQVFADQIRQEEAVVWNWGSISGYEVGLGKGTGVSGALLKKLFPFPVPLTHRVGRGIGHEPLPTTEVGIGFSALCPLLFME